MGAGLRFWAGGPVCAGHSGGEARGPPPEVEGLGLPPHVPEAARSA